MHSEGYSTWSYVSVCLLVVTSHLWSICLSLKNCHILSGQRRSKGCVVFSETTPLQRSSTSSIERPYVQSAIFLRKSHMRMAPRDLHCSAFISLIFGTAIATSFKKIFSCIMCSAVHIFLFQLKFCLMTIMHELEL